MSESRRRRRAVKKIDYSKDQEFSDDDVFEDGLGLDNNNEAGVGVSTVPGNGIHPDSSAKSSSRKAHSNTTAADRPSSASLYQDSVLGLPTAEDFLPQNDKLRYVEKGYDASQPHIRARFTFMPELEADGSTKVEQIVGRRLVEDDGKSSRAGDKNSNANNTKDNTSTDEDENDENDDDDDDEDDDGSRLRKKRKTRNKSLHSNSPSQRQTNNESPSHQTQKHHGEYEYLIKYKGLSYLHLEWKAAAELESMNKSAKTLYRRFLRKLQTGADDDLEDPEVDPSFVTPQKIVDEDHHEEYVDLSDKELVQWEKQQALEEEEGNEDGGGLSAEDVKIEGLEDDDGGDKVKQNGLDPKVEEGGFKDDDKPKQDEDNDGDEEIGEPGTLSKEDIMRILNKEGSYYPVVDGSDNPYRDGYITEPPKKPRASYLFFQGVYRSKYQKMHEGASVGEIMTILGDTWRTMKKEEQEPFIELAKEEAMKYEKQRVLLEKAQRPNELWQPIRRCKMVVERLMKDGFANIFLEPVDLSEFHDYLEYVETPMDLGTVMKKLNTRKYQGPENFARDMRKIWNNCKVYNQHGSAIWHVADYMQKTFERLYHAWVMEYRERYLRWVSPTARPWELSCRKCDGACKSSDEKMVLCDHCDAMYGMACLDPPLSKLPTGIWHCPVCAPKINNDKGVRMLSAVAEQAARKRAELGDVPKKRVLKKKYLVKWSGLGYEHCTWETQSDVNADELIDEFHKVNNMTPDEPNLTEEEARNMLSTVTHLTKDNAGGLNNIPELRCTLYSQARAFQFLKFGMPLPYKLGKLCGSETSDSIACEHIAGDNPSGGFISVELTKDETVSSNPPKLPPNLPAPLAGEYDAIIPITSTGLMMNVGEYLGNVAFLGYRRFPDGSKGPAEKEGLIKNAGDLIIAVDGVSTVNKSFQEVINMLRDSGNNQYACMRFFSQKYCTTDLTSMGMLGRFVVSEIKTKIRSERRQLLMKRRMVLENDKGEESGESDEESDGSVDPSESVDSDDSDDGAGDFVDVSDDEDLVIRQKARHDIKMKRLENNPSSPSVQESVKSDTNCKTPIQNGKQPHGMNPSLKTAEPQSAQAKPDEVGSKSKEIAIIGSVEVKKFDNSDNCQGVEAKLESATDMNVISSSGVTQNPSSHERSNELLNKSAEKSAPVVDDMINRQETTQSLALRLLDSDIGYSSDEAGDEDCAYFLDGVDDTFLTQEEALSCLGLGHTRDKPPGNKKERKAAHAKSNKLPSKKNDFVTLGARAKLLASINLSNQLPDSEDFDNYPLPSTKQMEAILAEKEAREKLLEQKKQTTESSESVALSKTKVEQLSKTTNEVIRVWSTAEDAATTLQIPLKDIKNIVKGIYNEDIGDEAGGYRWRYAAEDAEVSKSADMSKEKNKGKKAFLEFRDKLYAHNKPHNYKNGNRLRDYQVDGVNWLASCWYKSHSCILADEMGLGKTVQIVCYIEHLHRVEKIQRPFLVVVPLSTVEHWRREFEGWSDLKCCVYHDRQRIWRDVMREYEWYFVDRPHTPDFLKFDVLVTTYDTLIGDFDVIGQIPWRVTVVDEAHRLRNQKGKLLECMKEISARGTLQHGFQSRVLMTGTPLQNNIQELWTLLNFIEPYQFPSLEEFDGKYGNMASREQVEALQQKISPFMLRRVKEDVAKDIPDKEETLIDVELTRIQKQYYRAIFEHNHSFLNMGSTRNSAPKLMNIQMELRKCCNHPFLLDGVETRETERQQKELLESGELDGKEPEEVQAIINNLGYVMSSGKMVLLDKLLPKLRKEGHKVLIFSQMVKMLDLLSEYCDFRGFNHERLDGRVRGTERQKAIDRFETDDDSFIFMLSTRAGGVGINLTAADICIIFDSDWNPQNDVQAQARCHRIGQTKSVMIYRLITSRTFEQEMFDRASKKLGLEQAVLGTFGDDDDGKPTAKEMEQLLKQGAYALLDDNDEITDDFCADDIENILTKRTRTRVVENAKTASWLNKKGMVTKSKFTSDSKSAGLDMDDPDFWQKVMPNFVTPSLMQTKLEELESLTTDQSTGSSPSGRGRGRKRIDMSKKKKNDTQITRTSQKKINQFFQDLKGLMDSIFEDIADGTLPDDDKDCVQMLLLNISVKEKLFTEEQRLTAKKLLKRVEGDKRRKCRNTGDEPARFKTRTFAIEPEAATVNKRLLITSSKKRRKKRRKDDTDEIDLSIKKRKKISNQDQDEDDDSELDLSDINEDVFNSSKKRKGISKKEARRRRPWASDKDAAKAAGRPWPSFPRNKVPAVLQSLLSDVIKADRAKGGLFCEPVPQDSFPEYYDMIKNPMDYGTMQQKLEQSEYRTAQAMQKDFVLIMSNCLQFNSANSEIVREARQQTLQRPSILRKAAAEHNLFLAEDGSVIDVYSDDENEDEDNGKSNSEKTMLEKTRRGKKRVVIPKVKGKNNRKKLVRCQACDPCMRNDCGDCEPCKDKKKFGGSGTLKQSCVQRKCENLKEEKARRGRPRKKKLISDRESEDSDNNTRSSTPKASLSDDEKSRNDVALTNSEKKTRPRIRIKLSGSTSSKTKEDNDLMDRIPKKRRKVEVDTSGPDTNSLSDGEIDEGSTACDREKIQLESTTDSVERAKSAIDVNDAKNISDDDTESIKSSDSEDTKSNNEPNVECEFDDAGSIYMDIETLRDERAKLDGSLLAARSKYVSRGPWCIPKAVGEDKFKEVAKATIDKICRYDEYNLFAEKVTEEEAPGYYDIITQPMDFGTMKSKLENGKYKSGSKGIMGVYHDFLLVMDNCALYNENNEEVLNEAGRLLSLLPEVFGIACHAATGKLKRKISK